VNRRKKILIGALSGALLVMAVWGYVYLSAQRDADLAAQTDLIECRQMAAQIDQLNRQPSLVSEHEKQNAELHGMIEKAALAAGIVAPGPQLIAPDPPRRVGDTPYQESPTRVMLDGVTLRQLVSLILNVTRADPGLNTESLHLSAPGGGGDTGDRWAADVVLSYLIYKPLQVER
jgi:hypothetical protein